MTIEELEQVWNSEDVVTIVVVTIAVEILEHWQRKIRAIYSEYWNLQFPNLKMRALKFPITLICDYKMRHTWKENRGGRRSRSKKKSDKEEIKFPSRNQGCTSKRNCIIDWNSFFLILFLFIYYSLIMKIYSMARTWLFNFFSQAIN